MPTIAQLLSIAALLVVPGPTNVLVAAGGAAGGWRTGMTLGAAAASGYVLSVGMLALVAGPALAGSQHLPALLKAAATLWLLVCAWRLWRDPSTIAQPASPVGPAAVFMTTVLNPKALVFAFALAPVDDGARPAFLGSIAVLTLCSSALWALLGSMAARGLAGRITLQGLNKGGAVVLTGFAAALGVSALG